MRVFVLMIGILAVGVSATMFVFLLRQGPQASESYEEARRTNELLRSQVESLRERVAELESRNAREPSDSPWESMEARLSDLETRLEREAAEAKENAERRLAWGKKSGKGEEPYPEDATSEEAEGEVDTATLERTRRALAVLEREKTNRAISNWIERSRGRLDRVIDRATNELELDGARALQVRRILEDSSEAQSERLDALYGDPPPDDEEYDQIVGEMKQEVGERNELLAEVLSEDEMRAFQVIEKTTGVEDDED